MVFEEKTLDSEMIYNGAIMNVRRDKVTVLNGTSYREIVEHSGGAAIAALTDDGKMVMVKQFRYPAGQVMLEVPAGKRDPGETRYDTAVRELREETGYCASHVRLLTQMFPAIGYSEEMLELYLCYGLTPGETDFDENEALDNIEIPLDELYDMVMRGEILDGKTQVAILMTKQVAEAENLVKK